MYMMMGSEECCLNTATGRISASSKISKFMQMDFEQEILRYFQPTPKRIGDDPLYDEIWDDVRKLFEITKVQPLAIEDALDCFPQEKKPDRQVERDEREDIKAIVYKLKTGTYKKCSVPARMSARVLITRRPKFKLIWSFPTAMNYAESMFGQPLVEGFKAVEYHPYALWIYTNIKNNLRKLRQCRRYKSQSWLSVEWKQFNHCVPAWMIRDCFQIILQYLDFSGYQNERHRDSVTVLEKLWSQIVFYFINTPIRMPIGIVHRKKQGIPIGSYFAHMMETLVNSICTQYVLRHLKIRYARASQWYLSHQGLILIYDPIDLRQFAEVAAEVFGFRLDLSQTKVGETAYFAGYEIPRNRAPIPDDEKLAAAVHLTNLSHIPKRNFFTHALGLELAVFGSICTLFELREDYAEDGKRPNKLQLGDFPPLRDTMLRLC